MKLHKQIIFILIVFLKTETLLSENNLFNVNNIQLEKKENITNDELANQAIKKGFDQLIKKILLKEDLNKLSNLNFTVIKQLVTYYQISEKTEKQNSEEVVNFSVTFDKDKIHELFFEKGVSYSDITDKELFILPVLIRENEVFIFNNNFFYENWNNVYENELIEFILPLENIEIIQNINKSKQSLLDISVENLFKEYSNKNLVLILIEINKSGKENIYIKARIQKKNISKNLNNKKQKKVINKTYDSIIINIKKELINLVKSENLIDIRTPSFLNAKLDLNKKSNLVELNTRIKNVDLIENVFVQEFNKDYVNLRIKYLGKLDKIIRQLKNAEINLQLINDQWFIKAL
tara:strand:- start:213 stop:1259 length:1047 start_codon:yes stop_codon:yes gene_type:complete